MLLHIDGAGSEPALLEPADVDRLRISVGEENRPATVKDFPLTGAVRPLSESLVLVPGSAAGGKIHVHISGLHGGVEIARGEEDAEFLSGRVVEIMVHLDWLPAACLDGDGDGFGRGPRCAGGDCDDTRLGVHPGQREECNLLDDDCDEAIDEPSDLDPPRCALYKGVCQEARKKCLAGAWQECAIVDYGERYQDIETLCDGFDNDCDGAVDEGCVCSQGQTRSCAGPDLGECRPGEQVCLQVGGNWVWSEICTGIQEPQQDLCDSKDNDCDGKTDEDFDLQTDVENCGECGHACVFPQGRGTCLGGDCVLTGCDSNWYDINGQVGDGCEYFCTPDVPPSEVCDNRDNDCDGLTDEDFALQTDVENCGECGHACVFPQGRGTCLGGDCVLTGCDTNWYDINGQVDDGCEYFCTPDVPPTEVCDNRDNDCDGRIDGITGNCTGGLVCIGGECTCPDADGDGHTASFCGGDDCDDGRNDIHPGAEEFCDDVDTDCDGMGWDVVGVWERSITVPGFCTCRALGPDCVSVSASTDGTIALACVDGFNIRAAVIDGTNGSVFFSDWVFGASGTGAYVEHPRIAHAGGGRFVVAADPEEDATWGTAAVFTAVDRNGVGSVIGMSRDPLQHQADIETAPWGNGEVVALYRDYGPLTGGEPAAIRISSQPAFLGSPIDTDVDSLCCAAIRHELLYTPDGLVAIGYDNNLTARWIIDPFDTAGTLGQLGNCGHNYEIRASATYPHNGRRGLVAAVTEQGIDVFLLEIGQVGTIGLLESRRNLGYKDAAPVSVAGNGLLMVALRPSGEVVLLASDGTLAGLAEISGSIATGVDVLDAASLGGGRVAIAMVGTNNTIMLQIRSGVCTP